MSMRSLRCNPKDLSYSKVYSKRIHIGLNVHMILYMSSHYIIATDTHLHGVQ